MDVFNEHYTLLLNPERWPPSVVAGLQARVALSDSRG